MMKLAKNWVLLIFFYAVEALAVGLPPEEVQKRLQRFDYQVGSSFGELAPTPEYEGEFSNKWKGKIQSDGEEALHFNYYQALPALGETLAPSPLIVILPTASGVSLGEELVAQYLVGLGISSVVVESDDSLTNSTNTIEHIDSILVKSTIQLRKLLDWVQTREEIDPSRLGVLGISLGGVRAALLLGVEPRIKAGALFVAGGNLAEIFTNSSNKKVRMFRAHNMKKFGLTRDQFYEALSKKIQLDPLVFAPLRASKDVFMITARRDVSVPSKNQRELWQAFGQPERKIVGGGHFGGTMSIVIHRNSVVRFFKDRFFLR